MNRAPQRIVCLSAEAADWLWRLGVWDTVVGVTAFFEPPPGAAPKPRVSGFSSGNLEQIAALEPDLVITFSDVQAQLAADLIQLGFPVLATNQRTLAEIESTLAMLGQVVRREAECAILLRVFRESLAPVKTNHSGPRVYFEEWHQPLISGIAWVSELVERAGGIDIFPELRAQRSARDRTVDPEAVLAADPEVILASWCGEAVDPTAITSRPGWQDVSAVRSGRLHEIPSENILQPGFRLVHGYAAIKQRLQSFSCVAALSH